jgi:hypothetical protein
MIKISEAVLLSTHFLAILWKSFMTVWEVAAHVVGNAGLLCQSVVICNSVSCLTTFGLVLELVR